MVISSPPPAVLRAHPSQASHHRQQADAEGAALSIASSRASTSSSHTHVATPHFGDVQGSSPISKNTRLHSDSDQDASFGATNRLEEGRQLSDVSKTEPQDASTAASFTFPSDAYLVDWEGPEDPAHPLNWSPRSRWWITTLCGILILNATLASSAPSGIAPQIMDDFGVNEEVATLPLAVFIAGYCAGPILWGPLSERRGRKFCFIFTFALYTILQIGCALAPNIGGLLALRFLSGVFASAPLSVAGAVIADVHPDRSRGVAMAVFSCTPFCGPALGPLIAGFLTVSGTSWRWLFWVYLIFSAFCTLLIYFCLPETYAPYLLSLKARKLRKETAYDLLLSPFVMLLQEPMLLLTSLFMSYVYGILYLMFSALPFIFVDNHHWSIAFLGFAFLPLAVGGIFTGFVTVYYFNPRYVRAMDEAAPMKPPPEIRLELALVFGPVFAISLFIMGWTGYSFITPVAPLIGVFLCGAACIGLFLALMNYIVDVYLARAATALSINTVLRSACGAGFPMFANALFGNLGVQWASTLLGCLAVLMVPIPFLFQKYGRALRHKSKSAAVLD